MAKRPKKPSPAASEAGKALNAARLAKHKTPAARRKLTEAATKAAKTISPAKAHERAKKAAAARWGKKKPD